MNLMNVQCKLWHLRAINETTNARTLTRHSPLFACTRHDTRPWHQCPHSLSASLHHPRPCLLSFANTNPKILIQLLYSNPNPNTRKLHHLSIAIRLLRFCTSASRPKCLFLALICHRPSRPLSLALFCVLHIRNHSFRESSRNTLC